MDDKRMTLDEQLKDIAGGGFGEDLIYSFSKFGNSYKVIKDAIDTNICPVCNKQIIPDAKKCLATDFFAHVKSSHPDL